MLLDKAKQETEVKQLKYAFIQVMLIAARKVPATLVLHDIQHFLPLIPHFIETSINLEPWIYDEDVTWTFIAIARFYKGQTNYKEAVRWSEHCLTIAKRRFDDEHLEIALCPSNLAKLHYI